MLILKHGIWTGNLLGSFFSFFSFSVFLGKVVQSQILWTICMDFTISGSNSKSEQDIVHNMMNSDMRSAKLKMLRSWGSTRRRAGDNRHKFHKLLSLVQHHQILGSSSLLVLWQIALFCILKARNMQETHASGAEWINSQRPSVYTIWQGSQKSHIHGVQSLSNIFLLFIRFSEKIQIVKNSQYGKCVRIKKVPPKCIQKKLMVNFLDSLILERKCVRTESTDKATIKEYGNLSTILF